MKVEAVRVVSQTPGQASTVTQIDRDSIGAGEVLIKVHYSGINYKDALAVTGRGKIARRLPLVAGIDLAGEVVASDDPDYAPGTLVLANGCGLGETHDGGFAEFARLPSDWVIPLPEGLSLREAMILGTAGFTAALALHRMEVNGQNPAMGPLVVTGATGGVGAFAARLAMKAGYEVVAVSGRVPLHDWLRRLGITQVVTPEALSLSDAPLQTARFGGVIDNVGGPLLAKLISSVQLWGNVASIGLAASAELSTTVFPFILRGVSLLGVSSANCPMVLRHALWERLAEDWKLDNLEQHVVKEVSLAEVPEAAEQLLARKLKGRVLVRVTPPQ